MCFPSRLGRPVLSKPLQEEGGLEGSSPATQGCVDHRSLRVVEVSPMEEKSLCVMRGEVPISTGLINIIAKDRELLASGSNNHCSIS